MEKKFTIVIPIFNEVESIFELVEEINTVFKNNEFQILIVNDGSTDSFLQESKIALFKNNIDVISHEYNKGKCAAMLTGVKNSKPPNFFIKCILILPKKIFEIQNLNNGSQIMFRFRTLSVYVE